MLQNPFTPTEIASLPDDFFGRTDELRSLERSLILGSVAIQGPIGIGKSSLLAQGLLKMEGFDSSHSARTIVAVADKDINDIEQAARMLVNSLVEVDEVQKRVKFKIGSFFERESAEISRNFVDGKHLAILKRLIEKEYLNHLLDEKAYLILAIDEADKSPIALARLIRIVLTQTQQQGIKRLRFLLAGVSPFFQKMVDEDTGVSRFFYQTISLLPLTELEATELLESKLSIAAKKAEEDGYEIRIAPEIVQHVVALSGGHPHILQLLGSHLIEHEDAEPDGVIDERDLVKSLRRICYEDRARVYDSTLHNLDINLKLDTLRSLLHTVSAGFPTRIDKNVVARLSEDGTVQAEDIHWLIEHNVLANVSENEYGLIDEFLRIRMLMDRTESQEAAEELEQRLIEQGSEEELNEDDV